MIWNDLKKLKIEDIVLYINEQLEVKSMRKIAEDLGLKDDSTIRKYITGKGMINWFKSKDDKSNTNVIEIVQGIKIDLPEANIKRTTIRINEKIWEDFNRFVEDNKPIDKHDLMGMALKEYMENYGK